MATVGELRDVCADMPIGDVLNNAANCAERITGKSCDDFEVESVDKLGLAAGTFNTLTKKKKIRADAVCNEQLATRVFVHELYHEGGVCGQDTGEHCIAEGFTERKASRALHVDPVDAYRPGVAAADTIVAEIGEARAYELASHGAQSTQLLVNAFSAALLGTTAANDDVDPAKVAETMERAEEVVELAMTGTG